MTPEPVEAFRKNLRKHCAHRGTATEIMRKSEIQRTYLYSLMRGDKVPTIETAAKIAAAIGVSLASMLEMPPEN